MIDPQITPLASIDGFEVQWPGASLLTPCLDSSSQVVLLALVDRQLDRAVWCRRRKLINY